MKWFWTPSIVTRTNVQPLPHASAASVPRLSASRPADAASMRLIAAILYNRRMTTKTDAVMDFLDAELETLKAEGRLVKLRVVTGHQAPVSIVDGKKVVNLTSNNYLALT